MVGLLLALAAVTPGPAHAEGATLAEVIRLALSRNERAHIARLSVISAEAAVTRARAGFLPTIGLTGNETLRPYTAEQNSKVVLDSNAANGSLYVSQPLLSLPAFPLYASAKHSRDSALHGETDSRRLLAFSAARAFFSTIAQQNLVTAAERRLDRANASLKDVSDRALAQLVSSNDVTRARVERASALQTVAAARSSLQQARINLEYIIYAGLPAALTNPPGSLGPPVLDVDRLTAQALIQRPDLAAARSSHQAAMASAKEPPLRFVPTLSSTAQLRVADTPYVPATNRYYDATMLLNLSWIIWDAGVRGADRESRLAAAETAQLQMQALQRSIHADVRTAIAELTAARESLQAAEEGVAAARLSAEESTTLYKQGLAKAIELVDANLSRFNAESALAAAQLALHQAELDLRAALGLFPIDGVR